MDKKRTRRRRRKNSTRRRQQNNTRKKQQNNTQKKQHKKAKGKSVSKNRQLLEYLKEQGSLSLKINDQLIKLKIDNDIIEKIDNILKDEYDYQVGNKKKIKNELKNTKEALNTLLMNFPGEEELIELITEIERIENLQLENFNREEIINREEDVRQIKKETISLIEMGIENEQIAQSELTTYNNDFLTELEEMLEKI